MQQGDTLAIRIVQEVKVAAAILNIENSFEIFWNCRIAEWRSTRIWQ